MSTTLPLRLIDPLPGAENLMARAAAVRHNQDITESAHRWETDPPALLVIDGPHGPYRPVLLTIDPNACRYCEYSERDHRQVLFGGRVEHRRWSPYVGMHRYVSPTDHQRLVRMRKRRAHRLAHTAP